MGSGWGGYEVLRGVDKKRWGTLCLLGILLKSTFYNGCLDVTMVSANSYFNFTPLLASCAVGTLEFRCAVEPVSYDIHASTPVTD